MDQTPNRFKSFDGLNIAWTEMGPQQGRPTLLLHGFLANAKTNWILPSTAAAIAALGRRVILPDLRGHGASDAPEDLGSYPAEALPRDQEALLAHLGISDFDLVGYSLGARTSVRMMARGKAVPQKCILGGMGGSGVTDVQVRQAYFVDGIKNGPKAANARAGAFIQAFLAQSGMNPQAALGVLQTQVSTTPEELAKIQVPTCVVCGAEDRDNGDPDELAAMLGDAHSVTVPGNHLSAVTEADFIAAIVNFLK